MKLSTYQRLEIFLKNTSWVDRIAISLTTLMIGFTVIDPVFYELRQYANQGVVEFSGEISHLGRGAVVLFPAAIIFIITLFILDKIKSLKLRASLGQLCNLSAFVFFAVGGAGIIALSFKNLLGRARPKYFEEHGTTYFDPLTFDAAFASFPSGHATTSFAFAVAVSLVFPRLKYTLISIAFWVALSRFLIGAHFMTDIMVGAALGTCFAIYAKRLFASNHTLFKARNRGGTRVQGRYLLPWLFFNYLPQQAYRALSSVAPQQNRQLKKYILKSIRL